MYASQSPCLRPLVLSDAEAALSTWKPVTLVFMSMHPHHLTRRIVWQPSFCFCLEASMNLPRKVKSCTLESSSGSCLCSGSTMCTFSLASCQWSLCPAAFPLRRLASATSSSTCLHPGIPNLKLEMQPSVSHSLTLQRACDFDM